MTRLGRRAVLLADLAPLAAHAAPPDAAAPIEALNAGLLAAMRAGRATPFAQRYETLAPVVERAFDLPAILQASVGPRWTGLPPAQQEQLLDVFQDHDTPSAQIAAAGLGAKDIVATVMQALGRSAAKPGVKAVPA